MTASALSKPLPPRELDIRNLGRREYSEVWELQRELQQNVMMGEKPDTLILCEHEPCVTVGRSAKGLTNLRLTRQELDESGIPVFEIERGGDLTYHGPGQLVCYPILDLKQRHKDVHWYMRSLEEVLIRTAAAFRLEASRVEGRTGVWVKKSRISPHEVKIAAIGVRISRWVTMHGMSVNVQNCSQGFNLIHPCGITDRITSSLEQELGELAPSLSEVSAQMVHHFEQIMSYRGSTHG